MKLKLTVKVILFLIFGTCLSSNLQSQSFSLFSIDTSNYPTLSAKYLNVSTDGFVVPVPIASLILKENSAPKNILSLSCPLLNQPISLSTVLTVDVSVSMGFSSANATNMVFAKAASNAWINTLSVGNSECAVTSFDQYNYLHQDFTKDKTKLKNAVNLLVPQGQTDFTNAFLSPPSGAISIAKKGKNKRIILFVTDGDSPDTDISTIVSESNSNSISVYCISIGRECPESLKEISVKTGGLWFENIRSINTAEQVFFEIFIRESKVSPCEITWESTNQCKNQTIFVSLENTENMLISESPYSIPTRRKGTIQAIPNSVSFSDLPLFVQKDTIIFLKATGSGTTISSITTSNPSFKVLPINAIVTTGDSVAITISYTPNDSLYQWTEFVVEHSFCNATFYASSRYTNASVFPTVRLVSPNGGEKFLTGTDTVITWEGIAPSDTVKLEYSTNNGQTWNTITTEATGGSYLWSMPNLPSKEYLVKVSLIGKNDILTDGWAKRAGSFFEDIGYSIQSMSDGSILSTGSFQGFSNFSSNSVQLNSNGVEDIFILKIRPDGTPEWAKGIGGIGKDVGKKILVFSDDSFVVLGTFQNSIVFEQGNQNEQTLISNGGTDIFIARFLADGTLVWAKNEGGSGNDIVNDASISSNNEILLTGTFNNDSKFGAFDLFSSGLSDVFVASILNSGNVQWATSFGGSYNDEGKGIATTSDGSLIVAATTKGSFSIDNIPVPASGFDANALIVKFSASKNVLWVESISGILDETATALSVDKNNDIVLAGTFVGTFSNNGYFFTSNGIEDVFIFKYDQNKNFLWGTSFGGVNFDRVHSLFTDSTLSIYLAGFVEGLRSIGNSDLSVFGSKDVLVAKYAPTGTNEWAISAGGNVVDEAYDINVDKNGSVFSTGFFNSNATFGIFPLNTSSGFDEIFHWKIPTIRRKSFDVSDTTFELFRIQPITQTLQFGNVLINRTKDSLFTNSIENTSTIPISIDSITIQSNSVFKTLSNIPFLLQPSENRSIEFSFSPKQIGVFQSNVQYWLRTSDTTNNPKTTIEGIGIEPQLLVETPFIDFGDVEVSTNKDTLVPILLTNVGTVPITISSIEIVGPNLNDFTILGNPSSTTLNPNESYSANLRFSPVALGRTQTTIQCSFDGEGAIEKVFLIGNGIDYNQSIYSLDCQTIQTTIGSTLKIPFSLSTLKSGNTFKNEIIKGIIRFNETLLAPIENTPKGFVVNGERIIPFEFPLETYTGEVFHYTFKVGLGNDSMTTIKFENVVLENSTAEINGSSCSVLVTDLCYDGGTRLIKNGDTTGIVSISFPQNSTEMDVQYSCIENNTTISVFSVLGVELYSTTVLCSNKSIRIPINSFPNGVYFVVLKSPTISVTYPITIVR